MVWVMTPEQAKAVLVTTAARGGNMVWVGEFFQQKRLVVTTAARGGNMVWANNPTFASGAESHNGRTGRQYGLGNPLRSVQSA